MQSAASLRAALEKIGASKRVDAPPSFDVKATKLTFDDARQSEKVLSLGFKIEFTVTNNSEQAVKEHVSRLLQRFAVTNRAALGDAAATMRFVGTFAIDQSRPVEVLS